MPTSIGSIAEHVLSQLEADGLVTSFKPQHQGQRLCLSAPRIHLLSAPCSAPRLSAWRRHDTFLLLVPFATCVTAPPPACLLLVVLCSTLYPSLSLFFVLLRVSQPASHAGPDAATAGEYGAETH